MTLLLASVTGSREAELAVTHGADIIDLKDPSQGALGALELSVVSDVSKYHRGAKARERRYRRSADGAWCNCRRRRGDGENGRRLRQGWSLRRVKRKECIRALASFARRTKIVGVMFADSEPDNELISLMAESGFAGAMMDTARKDGRRLLDHADPAAIGRLRARAAVLMGC